MLFFSWFWTCSQWTSSKSHFRHRKVLFSLKPQTVKKKDHQPTTAQSVWSEIQLKSNWKDFFSLNYAILSLFCLFRRHRDDLCSDIYLLAPLHTTNCYKPPRSHCLRLPDSFFLKEHVMNSDSENKLDAKCFCWSLRTIKTSVFVDPITTLDRFLTVLNGFLSVFFIN